MGQPAIRPVPSYASAGRAARAQDALWQQQGVCPTEDERFDLASGLHEDTLAKAAGALGQTFAGAVLADDLVALAVLAADDGPIRRTWERSAFSGGGGRSLCSRPWITGSGPAS